MRSSSSSMPIPCLAEVRTAWSAGMPTTCSICSRAALRLGRGQVDLVDHRHDRQVVVHREIGVGECLRLDALGRVHDEDRPLAGRERARHLVGEVHVPGRVDQVQDVVLAVARPVAEGHRPRLDRDAALLLELHVVEHLLVHLARGDRAADLQDPVRERRLAVVDVRDDGEVADEAGIGHERTGDDMRGGGAPAARLGSSRAASATAPRHRPGPGLLRGGSGETPPTRSWRRCRS